MKKNDTHKHIPYKLILDEHHGTLPEDEREALEKWKAASPGNMEISREVAEISENTALLEIRRNLDPEKSWSKFQTAMVWENSTDHTPRRWIEKFSFLRMAAAAVLLIGILITISLQKGDGNQYISTGKNERRQLKLPDGSEVIMNQNTSLSYNPGDFSYIRKMKLISGEAYFMIKHDESMPFRVVAGGLTVEDLGTSFNLQIDTKHITVIVNRGKVAMADHQTGQRVLLDPREKGVFDKTGTTIIKSKNDQINFKSWYDKTLQYQQTPLSEVSKDLENIYGKKIIFSNESLKKRKLSAYFKNKSADEIMQIIGVSLRLKVTKEEDNFRLTEQ